MPIQDCNEKGKPGKKFGTHGKCYIGKDAIVKAMKQMKDIKANEKVKHEKSRSTSIS